MQAQVEEWLAKLLLQANLKMFLRCITCRVYNLLPTVSCLMIMQSQDDIVDQVSVSTVDCLPQSRGYLAQLGLFACP